MGPQSGLPRALLVLLFAHLSPLGSRPHPLGGPGPASKLSQEQPSSQELGGHARGPAWELQKGQTALEPLRQGRRPWEAGQAASAGGRGPRDSVLQALRGLQRPKMRDSGCFGGRLDRIGAFSGLGCNVLRRH